jgi:hypothetical protein
MCIEWNPDHCGTRITSLWQADKGEHRRWRRKYWRRVTGNGWQGAFLLLQQHQQWGYRSAYPFASEHHTMVKYQILLRLHVFVISKETNKETNKSATFGLNIFKFGLVAIL